MNFGDFNIWGVKYVGPEGPEIEQLKSKYDNLQKTVMALLSEGLSPSEVLTRLPLIEKQKSTGKRIADTLK